MGLENGTGYDDTEPEDLGDLATLVGESFQDAVWYIYRRRAPGEVVDKTSNPNAPIYVAKMVGELDLDALARLVGGGSFKVCGYRGNRKFVERPLEVEGPRKRFDNEPAPVATPAPVAVAVAPAQDGASARLDRLERLLEAILQKPAPAPPATPFTDVIAAAKLLRGDTPPQQNADAVAVKGMVEVFKEGIALGSKSEGSTGTDWGAIVEKSLPVLEKVMAGVFARGRRPVPGQPPRSMPPGTPASSAVVVETSAPEPAEPEESPRMAAVVEALARAIDAMGTDDERDPADMAETVRDILNPLELSMVRASTAERLMSELAQVSERFPAFQKPQAAVYVDAVLSAIKNPPTDAE